MLDTEEFDILKIVEAAKDNISLFKLPFVASWRIFASDYDIIPRIKDDYNKFVTPKDVLGLETLPIYV